MVNRKRRCIDVNCQYCHRYRQYDCTIWFLWASTIRFSGCCMVNGCRSYYCRCLIMWSLFYGLRIKFDIRLLVIWSKNMLAKFYILVYLLQVKPSVDFTLYDRLCLYRINGRSSLAAQTLYFQLSLFHVIWHCD